MLDLHFLLAKIVIDRVSDRSKGFGFVTYASEDEAQKAIKELNGKVGLHFIFSFFIFPLISFTLYFLHAMVYLLLY